MNPSLHDMTDDLLVKFLLQEATVEEHAQVEQWLLSGDDNKKYFAQFKMIWEESAQLAEKSTINETDAWQRFQERRVSSATPVRKMNIRIQWLRIAAVFVIMISVGWLVFNLFNKPSGHDIEILAARSQKESKIVVLPDSSVITLNKNTTITYPAAFTGNERKISLVGEAFFNITPNKKKPFIISVNDITVKVVGTSFNIKSKNGFTEVIVETGIVQVMQKGNILELKPGEKTEVLQTTETLKKETATDKLYNYYRSKEFECDNTPLWKVVEVLNEAYDANIIIERKEVAALPLTTTFYNRSLDSILDVIVKTFELKLVKNANQIILK